MEQLESFDYVSVFNILVLDSNNFLAALDSGEVYHFQEFENTWKKNLAFKGVRQSAVHLSKNNQFIVCSFSQSIQICKYNFDFNFMCILD